MTTLDEIIKDIKIKTINDKTEETFFFYVIDTLRKTALKYDFFTNNVDELKNILTFVGKYHRIIDFRNSVLVHEEHGREFCFAKTSHFDDEISKFILNKKLKKIKC